MIYKLDQRSPARISLADRVLRADRGGSGSRFSSAHRHRDGAGDRVGQERQSAALHAAVQRQRDGELGDRHVRHTHDQQRPGHRPKRERQLQLHAQSGQEVLHRRPQRKRVCGGVSRQRRARRVLAEGRSREAQFPSSTISRFNSQTKTPPPHYRSSRWTVRGGRRPC